MITADGGDSGEKDTMAKEPTGLEELWTQSPDGEEGNSSSWYKKPFVVLSLAAVAAVALVLGIFHYAQKAEESLALEAMVSSDSYPEGYEGLSPVSQRLVDNYGYVLQDATSTLLAERCYKLCSVELDGAVAIPVVDGEIKIDEPRMTDKLTLKLDGDQNPSLHREIDGDWVELSGSDL